MERGELDKGIQDIEELFDDSEKILKKENEAKKQHLKWRLRKQKNYVKNQLKLLVKQSLGKGKRAQAQNQKKNDDHQII